MREHRIRKMVRLTLTELQQNFVDYKRMHTSIRDDKVFLHIK
jgi:hypothetical protein